MGKQEVLQALYNASGEEREVYINPHFDDEGLFPMCAVSRNVLRDVDEAVVDYVYPNTFESLVGDFLISKNLDWDDVKVDETENLVDEKLHADWVAYHVRNANLRLVDAKIAHEIPRDKLVGKPRNVFHEEE